MQVVPTLTQAVLLQVVRDLLMGPSDKSVLFFKHMGKHVHPPEPRRMPLAIHSLPPMPGPTNHDLHRAD